MRAILEHQTVKMESLEFCKFLLRLLGLWSINPAIFSILLVLRCMANMIFHAITLVALSLYILFHSDDINETIETGFACFAFATTMFIYCWMIKRKPLIDSAITKLDTVIDQSKYIFITRTTHIYPFGTKITTRNQ